MYYHGRLELDNGLVEIHFSRENGRCPAFIHDTANSSHLANSGWRAGAVERWNNLCFQKLLLCHHPEIQKTELADEVANSELG